MTKPILWRYRTEREYGHLVLQIGEWKDDDEGLIEGDYVWRDAVTEDLTVSEEKK